jgi:deazaflavin-dependent oxidoreductase (nitroreductase family)
LLRKRVVMYKRPTFVTRLFNKVVGFLASLGLTPEYMITLEVRGRRSGRPRTVVVNTVEYEGQRYLVSPRGQTEWVRNVGAAAGEAVVKHGRRRKVKLEELPPQGTARILKAYLQRNTLATRAQFGLKPDAPLEEFERAAERHPVFRLVEEV